MRECSHHSLLSRCCMCLKYDDLNNASEIRLLHFRRRFATCCIAMPSVCCNFFSCVHVRSYNELNYSACLRRECCIAVHTHQQCALRSRGHMSSIFCRLNGHVLCAARPVPVTPLTRSARPARPNMLHSEASLECTFKLAAADHWNF